MESDWCPPRRSIPYPGLTGVGKRGHGDGKMGRGEGVFFFFFKLYVLPVTLCSA